MTTHRYIGRIHSGASGQPARRDLQQRLGLTYLFISHDLSMVAPHCQPRLLAVMYLGRIVGWQTAMPCARPQTPYSQALLSAVPRPDPQAGRTASALCCAATSLAARPPRGCAFSTRCPQSLSQLPRAPALCTKSNPAVLFATCSPRHPTAAPQRLQVKAFHQTTLR